MGADGNVCSEGQKVINAAVKKTCPDARLVVVTSLGYVCILTLVPGCVWQVVLFFLICESCRVSYFGGVFLTRIIHIPIKSEWVTAMKSAACLPSSLSICSLPSPSPTRICRRRVWRGTVAMLIFLSFLRCSFFSPQLRFLTFEQPHKCRLFLYSSPKVGLAAFTGVNFLYLYYPARVGP